MNIEVKDLSSVKKTLLITIPKETINEKYDLAYKDYAKTSKIKGFRPGKAPKNLVKKTYGSLITQDLFKEIINETYYQAITEKKFIPLTTPQIDPEELKEGSDFKYSVTIEIKPEFTNLTYKNLNLTKEKVEITEENVEREIDSLRNYHATTEKIDNKDHQIEKLDIVKIDFEGFYPDGKPLENGKGEDYQLEIGSNSLIPSLEDGIIGMKLNEEKKISATFPSNYQKEDLKGKIIDFKVKVKEINKKILPEINDEFAKSLKEYNSIEDMKSKIRNSLIDSKERDSKIKLQQDIAEKIIEANKFEVPETIVLEQRKRLIEEANMRLAYIGKENLENYIRNNEQNFSEQALANVKLFFIFEEIAKLESIKINDNDVDEEINKISKNSSKSVDEIKSYYKQQGVIDDLKYRLKEEKIYNLIIETSTVETTSAKDKQ